jgi:hypothetical protein
MREFVALWGDLDLRAGFEGWQLATSKLDYSSLIGSQPYRRESKRELQCGGP